MVQHIRQIFEPFRELRLPYQMRQRTDLGLGGQNKRALLASTLFPLALWKL
jgi:hypothetical protein